MPVLKTLSVTLALLGWIAPAARPQAVGMDQPRKIPAPPVAKAVPFKLEKHGHVRIDPYYWLRERENPEVLAYLRAENQYTEAVMAHTEKLQQQLFEEIRARMKESDISAPVPDGGYLYYTRYEAGKDYPIYARRRGSMEAPEEVLLDVNQLAEGHGFFAVMGFQVSPHQDLLAFAVDTVGRRISTLRFKNLATGEFLEDVIPNVTGNVAWANDNRTVFYTRQHPTTLRWYRIYRHVLGTDPSSDALVYEERDSTFNTRIFRTRSGKFLMIRSSQTLADEYRFLEADRPGGQFRVLLPRERGHEYEADHAGDWFYIRTNHGAANFRLVRLPVNAAGRVDKDAWEEVIPHREDVLLEGFTLFRDHLVLTERRNGLRRLRIRAYDGSGDHYLDFGEPAYTVSVGANREFDTRLLRYEYNSLTTPPSSYDYDMVTRERRLVKREEVLGGFDPANYVSERLYARARDGIAVPVSIVYRKGLEKNGDNPLLLYGYGSYGSSVEPTFSALRLSLLDRGFVYAIAHVRGGQELGRQWYEDGKLLRKMNTFTDFIDVAEFLIEQRYTRPEKLFAQGGSAGGLLMGAVVNLRPDLFKGVVAQVPFVDVVTTMLDESIPLTTNEYDEWGNPNDPEYYRYILAYSPYDNVERKAYPNLLVTTGLHDSQVQYWEPAKWVAKLRAMKTDHNRLILKTNFEAGHGGASGRYQRWRETAFIYAFILDLAGLGSGGDD
ncbi:MAG: oligopeptidase B [Gemmatimonadales bacterium]|nr:MAG: oligopeptidase B [Gemmatimonadales bacterium]